MNTFGLLKEPKNIIELFTFDLTSFFYEEDYTEIHSEEVDGIFMIEYSKELPWIEHELFENVVFRVFNDKANIVGGNHINVNLAATPEKLTVEKVHKLVDQLYQIYSYDDENKGQWSQSDLGDFQQKTLERLWTLGENKNIYSVKLTYSSKYGLELKILFFNHLLNLLNK
jgi:hypothetical protein